MIVSNHGGRNLDFSVPPLFALPDIVDRAGSRVDVMMDGGIMRGSDVIKALALGAKAVLVGRAPLWGVAAAGLAGANRALAILAEETLRVLGPTRLLQRERTDHRFSLDRATIAAAHA